MRLAEILRSKREIQIIQALNGLDPAPLKITLYDYIKNVIPFLVIVPKYTRYYHI